MSSIKPTHVNQTGHETFIPALCKLVGARSYLELGVYDGQTIWRVTQECPWAVCTGVDFRPVPDYPRGLDLRMMVDVHLVVSDIGPFFERLPADEMFDVIFIDANHSAESIWEDLKNALKHSPEHGLILLHDTYPKDEEATGEGWCGTAWEVASRINYNYPINPNGEIGDFEDKVLEAVTLPYHPGLTIIRKRIKHLNW